MIFYESPKRLVRTLEQFCEAFGPQRQCCVSREISKVHEEHTRGSLSEVLLHFRQNEPKGEIVIILAGSTPPEKPVHQNKYRKIEERDDDGKEEI